MNQLCLADQEATAEEMRNIRLVRLMEKTGYPLVQMNGQRVFGPPPLWAAPKPKRGSEIFVGKIPRNIFEDELVPVFESIGKIYQLRLMLDFTGKNRGYAFVTYARPELANLAVLLLNNYEIRPRRLIGVYKSIDNCRLFVGGLPLDKSQLDVWNKLEEYVEGIVTVIMYPAYTPSLTNLNRGYVFVEFCDHKSAAMARKQLTSGVMLWDTPAAVDWADPLPEVDQNIMKRVTKLYIRNLDITLTNNTLMSFLVRYVPQYMISRVHKVADYAFVHFKQRCDAEYALETLQGAIIAGNEIEVCWARPRIYSKTYRMNAPAQNFCTSVPPKMRRVVQQQKFLQQRGSEPTSSSSSESSSPCHSMYGSLNINVNEPFMNIVNVNMLSSSTTNMLPAWFSGLRL